MYSPIKFIYIYIYICMYVCIDKWLIYVCVRTLLFIYMSKMSGRDHVNLTTN